MPPQARLGDKALIPADAHGCPACPHTATGPAVAGSSNVLVNQLSAIRLGDPGIHAACCGPNTWNAKTGSSSVLINGRPAHRQGDSVSHCGGLGHQLEGSTNVIVGGSRSSLKTLPSHQNSVELFDGVFTVLQEDGTPAAGVPYRVTGPHVDVRGITDENGKTSLISTGNHPTLLKLELEVEPLSLTLQPNY